MANGVGKPSAYEGMVSALQRRGVLKDNATPQCIREQPDLSWMDESSHISDAFMYGTSAVQTRVVVEDPLAKFKDHELIMALLKRGYAAMKLPADGGPPEVLR